MRKSYSVKQKLEILETINRKQHSGESLRSLAAEFDLFPAQIRNWRKSHFLLSGAKSHKQCLGNGHTSSIQHLEEDLLSWFVMRRELHLHVSYQLMEVKACKLDRSLLELPPESRYQVVRRFCIRHGMRIWRGTHQCQQNPEEVLRVVYNWFAAIRPVVNRPILNRSLILNMDQTPIPFSLSPKTTLAYLGERSIGLRRSGNSPVRATCALAISSAGDKLKPMIIFKGTATGNIARNELATYPTASRILYKCQKNAWMDADMVSIWIDQILHPYIQENGNSGKVLLFLDSYSAHLCPQTTNKLRIIGVKFHPLPPSTTPFTQPVNIGINKPFKDRLRQQWWEWIMRDGNSKAVISTPSRSLVGSWVDLS